MSIPDRLPAVSQDRMMYLGRTNGGQYTHYVLEFDRRLDHDRMRRAVRLALDAEPVLGCRYVPGRKPYWQRRNDLDMLDHCGITETADVRRELARFVATECDAAKDPLLQARIVRGRADTLLLKTAHATVDGTAAKQLAGLIAGLYRDGAQTVTPNRGNRGTRELFRQIGLRECLRLIRMSFPLPARNQWCFPSADREDCGAFRLAIRRLEPDASDTLRIYGKRFDATLNDIFLTACFRALWRFLDFPTGVPQSIAFPVDARRYLPSGSMPALCNFVAVMHATLERVPSETFEGTLIRTKKGGRATEAQRDHALRQILWMSILHQLALAGMERHLQAARQRVVREGKTSVIFSNNGDLEATPFDFGVPLADAYRVVHPMFAPGMLLYVSSFRKKLTFTVTYPSRAFRSDDIERFLDTFLEELPAGAGAILSPATPETAHLVPHLPNTK